MPFDLASAKPVADAAPPDAPTGGFDLASAKPVEQAASAPVKPAGVGPATTKPRKPYFPTTESETFEGAGEMAIKGVPEGLAATVTNALLTPVAGLAGIAATGYGFAKGEGVDEATARGAKAVESVTGIGYQPRSEAGKATMATIAAPMDLGGKALGAAGSAAGGLVGPKTGAALETVGENIIPAALAVEGGRRAMKPLEEKKPVAGEDYSPLRDMSKEEADRYHRMKQSGVEPTLGQVTQKPEQIRFEQQEANMGVGKRLLQRFKEQDAALSESISKLRGDKASPELTEKKAGQGVRSVVEREYQHELQKVDDLYEKARASGETKHEVDVTPLKKYLNDNEAAAIAVKELRSAKASLNKLIGAEEIPEGSTIGSGKISGKIKKTAKEEGPPTVTIDDLEFLRQQVGTLGLKDGSVKKYMGDIRQVIDKMTEGKGGQLYAEARSARKKLGDKYEEQAAVANIAEKKSRTDYKTAVEDVWHKTVIGGSDQDLANVVRLLKTAEGDKKAAAQSMRDLQAATIDHLQGEAMKNGTFSPASFERAMNSIGTEKLTTLLGEDAVKSLKRDLKNAQEMKRSPIKPGGSDTAVNIRTRAEKLAADYGDSIVKNALPGPIGKAYGAVREGMAKGREARMEREAVDESLTPRRAALTDIKAEADKTKGERRQYVMRETGQRGAPALAATIRPPKDDNSMKRYREYLKAYDAAPDAETKIRLGKEYRAAIQAHGG